MESGSQDILVPNIRTKEYGGGEYSYATMTLEDL